VLLVVGDVSIESETSVVTSSISRCVGPYKILERNGPVAYKLELPEAMGAIFPVFHVSHLKKCLRVLEERIEPQGIKLKSDLVYRE
jgi:hypothetical protein